MNRSEADPDRRTGATTHQLLLDRRFQALNQGGVNEAGATRGS